MYTNAPGLQFSICSSRELVAFSVRAALRLKSDVKVSSHTVSLRGEGFAWHRSLYVLSIKASHFIKESPCKGVSYLQIWIFILILKNLFILGAPG